MLGKVRSIGHWLTDDYEKTKNCLLCKGLRWHNLTMPGETGDNVNMLLVMSMFVGMTTLKTLAQLSSCSSKHYLPAHHLVRVGSVPRWRRGATKSVFFHQGSEGIERWN